MSFNFCHQSDVQLPGTALQLTTGRILLYCLITKKSVQMFLATDLNAAHTFVLSINVVCMKHLVSKNRGGYNWPQLGLLASKMWYWQSLMLSNNILVFYIKNKRRSIKYSVIKVMIALASSSIPNLNKK